MKKLAFAVVAALLAVTAQARSGYKTDFNNKYGTAGTVLDSCNTCHGSSTSSWNSYGQALMIAGNITAGTSVSDAVIIAALGAIEPLDSDGDTYTNIVEINARTFPGDATSHPTTVVYCPDNDNDGYAVCNGSCTVPAGKTCGDCDDNNAAVHPGAVEGPYGSLTCSDGLDNDCNGLIDAADAQCAPTNSNYDITALGAPATAILRQNTTVTVTVANVGAVTGGGTLTLVGTSGRKSVTLAQAVALTAAPGTSQTLSFVWKPNTTGVWTWTATLTDGSAPDAGDSATAQTTVTK